MLDEYVNYNTKKQYVFKLKKYTYFEGNYYVIKYNVNENVKYCSLKLVRDGSDYYEFLLDVGPFQVDNLPLLTKNYSLNNILYDTGIIYFTFTDPDNRLLCCSWIMDNCIDYIQCVDDIEWN